MSPDPSVPVATVSLAAERAPGSSAWLVLAGVVLASFVLLVILLWQRIRDLAVQSEMQRRLDETERLKDLALMAGGLAHEIRHPVSSIQFAVASARTRLRRLPAGSDDREEIEGILEGISTDVKRLEEITNAFLEYARPERQPAALCDLREACDFARRFLKIELRDQDVRVEADYPEHPVRVRIPEVHLRQILINLVLNAAQASPREGTIHLRVRGQAGRGAVEVEDHGAGIAPGAAEKLFRPFYTTKPKGVGLGLALSRRFARDAGGDLSHRPSEPRGATFVLSLPLADGGHEAPAPEREEPTPVPGEA